MSLNVCGALPETVAKSLGPVTIFSVSFLAKPYPGTIVPDLIPLILSTRVYLRPDNMASEDGPNTLLGLDCNVLLLHVQNQLNSASRVGFPNLAREHHGEPVPLSHWNRGHPPPFLSPTIYISEFSLPVPEINKRTDCGAGLMASASTELGRPSYCARCYGCSTGHVTSNGGKLRRQITCVFLPPPMRPGAIRSPTHMQGAWTTLGCTHQHTRDMMWYSVQSQAGRYVVNGQDASPRCGASSHLDFWLLCSH
ncbi:hypothetical protein B0H11DRAFT_2183598 [Mycena galericulata]|nr:hypothetical protein B0H11DRAFT_2183598 [Mycena galericulata]